MIELHVIVLGLALFFTIVVEGCNRSLERGSRNPWLEIGRLMTCWIMATLVAILYWQSIIYLMVQGQAYPLVGWKHALLISLAPVLWLSYRCFERRFPGAPKRSDGKEQGRRNG